MQRLLAALTLLATAAHAAATTCLASTGTDYESDCTKANFSAVCYRKGGDTPEYGCLTEKYIAEIDASAAGCNDDVCWCLISDCNTADWETTARASYVPPPMCFTGVAGSNGGPSCDKSQVYKDNEYESKDCYGRARSNECVENKEDGGPGDGCSDHNEKRACESYESDSGPRDTSESFDGTSNHCRWLPAKTKDELNVACQVDGSCKWYGDRGDCSRRRGTTVDPSECEGNCESSDDNNAKVSAWGAKRGLECERRTKFGCFENNDHLGEAEWCSDHATQSACLAHVTDCSYGACSGTKTDMDSRSCSDRSSSEGDCSPSSSGCTWTAQCCQWIAEPANLQETCSNSGAGTLAGVCEFNDGNGPPSADIVKAGYEYTLFKKKDTFTSHCALIASFVNGKGAAVAMGSDKINLVDSACTSGSDAWKNLAEHIGHTSATIDDYCTNFVPDTTAMAAFAQHTPTYIIAKAKEGQFGAVFPGFKDLLFIITSKPEFGECLFTANHGVFGAAVCTCDKKACNNETALQLIVNRDVGPMRLLQFIDGSLLDKKTAINGIVSGLFDAEGKINSANVGSVTEANVDSIMALDGMSSLTNKAELWGVVQDFQALATAQSNYNTAILADASYKKLEVDASKVAAANTAAGCELYNADGVPNTVCLSSLSAEKRTAVADATSIPIADVAAASEQATTGEAPAASGGTSPASPPPAGTASGAKKIASLSLVAALLATQCFYFLSF